MTTPSHPHRPRRAASRWVGATLLAPLLLAACVGADGADEGPDTDGRALLSSGKGDGLAGPLSGELAGVDDVPIAWAAWPVPDPRATVVVVPGRTESYLKYAEVIGDLLGPGYEVVAMDPRGQGLSGRMLDDPQRGFVADFDDYVDDLALFLDQMVGRTPGRPRVALAHSMGAAITLRLAQRDPGAFDALALSSPMLRIDTGGTPKAAAWALAEGASATGQGWRYVPGGGPRPEAPLFEDNVVTHSRRRFEAAEALIAERPEAGLGSPTLRWLREVLWATDAIVRDAALLTTPTLVMQAGDERVVDPTGQDDLCGAAPRCKLLRLDGAFHELLMETDDIRDRAMDATVAVIESTLEDAR